ncbi:MAG TPA: transcriptional regulator [Chitinophagaceae bacterium]|nr:transcriptional regulator [Chitinophagaceae bacterium]HCY90523.1 transcriptional regulator [Chitinophagaceae bacterium]HRF27104.1 metalloregulator ArsR/SmtB family transcription factor [Ferruginibacter sp.]
MGATKTATYNKKDILLATYAKALAHPARIAILKLLLKRQACVCGDIVEELPLSQSTVSQHLKELKEAGLIKGEIEGVSVCYCIDEKEWAKVSEILKGLFDQAPSCGKDGCC